MRDKFQASHISVYHKKSAFLYLPRGTVKPDLLFRLSAPLVVMGQSCKLCLLFLPAAMLGGCYLVVRREVVGRLFYLSIRMGLQWAGPTFAKLGQWAATRPDLLPLKLCNELGKLQSGAPAHDHAWNERVIQQIFGCPLEDAFVEFERAPAGSGTVGQVHQARMRQKPNIVVAVKIIHPGVHDRVERELLFVRTVAVLLDMIPGIKWMQFREQSALFAQMMRDQLDLRQEAWTLDRFSRNFRDGRVEFARPILATADLLVQTWEDGVSLEAYLKNVRCEEDSQNLTKSGLSAFLQMVLWDNFVHADLHPGNIKISSTVPPHLIILDTGLTIELSGMDHDNLADLFRAMFLDQNHRRVGELMLERRPQPQAVDREGFIGKVAELCEQISPIRRKGESMKLSGVPLGETFLKAFEVARVHRVQLEPAFTRVVMALVVIEGVGRQLYPDLDLMPIMRQAAMQYIISETARRLTQTIQPHL